MECNYTVGKHIAGALLEVQRNLEAAKKDATNPHHRNSYASITSVLDALKTVCTDAGVVIVQRPLPSENGMLTLETMAIHAGTGEALAGTITMPLAKSDPQGFGSALTYARRYGLTTFFSMQVADDDAEGAMPERSQERQSYPQSRPQTAQNPAPRQPLPARTNGANGANGAETPAQKARREWEERQKQAAQTATGPADDGNDDDPFRESLDVPPTRIGPRSAIEAGL